MRQADFQNVQTYIGEATPEERRMHFYVDYTLVIALVSN